MKQGWLDKRNGNATSVERVQIQAGQDMTQAWKQRTQMHVCKM